MRHNDRKQDLVMKALLISLIACLIAFQGIQAADPEGELETLSWSQATGWALDSDTDGAIVVHFYSEGIYELWAGSVLADESHPTAGQHGFTFEIPETMHDGYSHSLWGHALGVGSGAHHTTLASSPLILLGDKAELWMTYANPWELGDSSQWEYLAHNLTVLQLYIDQVNAASIDDLRALVDVVDRYGIRLSIECGGLVDWRASAGSQSGELSAADEMAKVRKLTDPVSAGGAGGTLAYLTLDGAIRRMLYPSSIEQGYHTVDSATDELVDAIQLWQAAYPELEYYVLTNFPNWGWKGSPAYNNLGFSPGSMGYGDYQPVLDAILEKTRAAGIQIRGVSADNPYDYTLGEHASNQASLISGIDFFERVRDLERDTEAEGLRFVLIYNSERAGNQTTGSNQLYSYETLAYIDDYHAIGGSPGVANIQSWYYHPTEIVPETQAYTMTHLAGQAAPKVKASTNPIGSPVGELESCNGGMAVGWARDNDDPRASVIVHLYQDDPFGTILGSTRADLYHAGAGGSYGFRFVLPASSVGHRIWAYALNLSATPGGNTRLFPSPVVARLVRNGSFESPPVSGFSYLPAGSGWLSQGGGFVIAESGSIWGNTALDGRQNMAMQGAVQVWQSISGLVAGETYKVAWAEADRPGLGGNDLQVLVDGVVVAAPHKATSTSWEERTSASFTASSGSMEIRFQTLNTDGGDRSIFVDAVRVEHQP